MSVHVAAKSKGSCRGYHRIRDPQFVTYERDHMGHQTNIAFFYLQCHAEMFPEKEGGVWKHWHEYSMHEFQTRLLTRWDVGSRRQPIPLYGWNVTRNMLSQLRAEFAILTHP